MAALAPAARADVVINEVNCDGTDWVELANTDAAPADVSGWLLTDEALDLPEGDEHLYEFGPSAAVPGDGHLVVETDTDFQFGISCSDTLLLGNAAAELVDQTTIGSRTIPSDTWGRHPDGTGTFQQTIPTQGEPNEPSSGEPPDLAAWMFEPSELVEIDLDLPQESIDALEAEPEEYVDATVSLSGSEGSFGPLEVGVRLKGSGSFRPLGQKAAFKVEFDHSVPGQDLLGLDKLTLNNMVQDPSMIHEVLAYEVFGAAGVPAPRAGYAYVSLNDEDYGVYLNIETLDQVSLPRHFDSTQHLFEGGYEIDVSPEDLASFEVDEGSETNLSDLEALSAAVNSSADFTDAVEGLADVEEMVRMWAVEQYVGHWDGYSPNSLAPRPNNYYLHSDNSGLFSMLPWGTDGTFHFMIAFDDPAGLMFERCLGDPSCASLYREAMIDVLATVDGLGLQELATSTAEMLRDPWQIDDPKREHTLEQIDAGVATTLDFIARRPGQAEAWLNPPPPPPGGDPQASAPETRITKRPKGRSRASRVRFSFGSETLLGSAGEPVGFQCRLDGGDFKACESPLRLRPGRGRHRFQVRAVLGSLVDATAAEDRFVILPPKG
jgi:CotH kinase protein/Lamin Tail Domain